MVFDWDEKKNKWLKKIRGVGFENVVIAINEGKVLGTIQHPGAKKYKHQKVHILNIKNYIYFVPFIDEKQRQFFKTIIPSRKLTKKYLGGKK